MADRNRWRIYNEDGDIVARAASCLMAIKAINDRPQQFLDVWYYNTQKRQWLYATTIDDKEVCSCGRSFVTPNGSIFMYRNIIKSTFVDAIAEMKKPPECAVCFYRKELAEGNFCPQWVKAIIAS